MALKVELKAGERFILGNCLVTNSAQRIQLLIEGDAPILREKDIMTADSPAKRIYFAIQLIYTARDPNPVSRNILRPDARSAASGAKHLASHLEQPYSRR